MKQDYKTSELTSERVDQAFPIVRETSSGLTLEAWRDFAEAMVAKREDTDWPDGIVAAELDGYIRGLFTYHVVPDIHHGRTLVVRDFTVLQVVSRQNPADALLDVIGELAERHHCTAVHAHVPADSAWATDYFEARGHELEKLVFCQPRKPSA